MPDRQIAAKFEKTKSGEAPAYVVRLVPRQDVEGLEAQAVVLRIKDGATQAQVEELESLINLLAIELTLER